MRQTAARVAGALYIVQMATAVFAESYVRGTLLTSDPAQTAKNIAASERLFRLGIAGDLFTYIFVITLSWLLYGILRDADRNLAMLAFSFRMVENAVAIVTTFGAFAALQLLETEPALARAALSVLGSGLRVAFVFTGIGSAVFSAVWLKSRLIPKPIAIWGIFASLLLTTVTLAIIVVPRLWTILGLSYMVPMGIYEIGLGFWLLIKGVRQ